MPSPTFRDRFFTRRVADAVTSPSGILLAGAGAAVGIVAGLPLAVAAAVGAAAWAARVAVAVPRGPVRARVDPSALDEPWRRFVAEALAAQARYRRAVQAVAPGPLRDRLSAIGGRLDDGVQDCWRVACHGQDLVQALEQLDVEGVRIQLVEAEARAARADPNQGGERAQRTVEALRAQLASAERVRRVADEALDRLRLLDARFDETVARAIELSLGTLDEGELSGLRSDVEELVVEMESLRQALEETGGTAALG